MAVKAPSQDWDPARYEENARFVSELGAALVELLNPKPGERILDIGCGDGLLTERVAEAGARVVGVDSSPAMVEAAARRGLDARALDAHSLAFDHEFDAAFSNAALHWMKQDPDRVLRGIHRALKPGGRLAAEMGGHGCVAAFVVALCATLERYRIENPAALIPWYFPTVDEYRERLERVGFRVEYIALIPRPTVLPTSIEGWLETFAKPFTKAVPPDERRAFFNQVKQRLGAVLCDTRGRWTADYVRLRLLARTEP
jgi:trans-aconitate methyltransferase